MANNGTPFDLTEKSVMELLGPSTLLALKNYREAEKAVREATTKLRDAESELKKQLKDWGINAEISGVDPSRMVQQ